MASLSVLLIALVVIAVVMYWIFSAAGNSAVEREQVTVSPRKKRKQA